MSKVKPKFELAILSVSRPARGIKFDCLSQDAVAGLERYGRITDYTEEGGGIG
jgi:hypothetical protein